MLVPSFLDARLVLLIIAVMGVVDIDVQSPVLFFSRRETVELMQPCPDWLLLSRETVPGWV